MLPSVLAKQLQQGLSDYIETTFPMTNPVFHGSLRRMVETPDSVFHEPYVAVRLPFRVAESAPNPFESIHPKFTPFVHQQQAYERLTGDDGRSTLIATGTGSGKTECFLYPILEYCWQHRGERGIKALIVYPMNALAADQARRIAELIYDSPELRSNVTAGMFVGGHEKNASRMMGPQQIITDHETMRSSPPDILLTNYKMLDYLLVRPSDAALWEGNKPDTLKYIAVDELHTFDGAQGTDLACLLRRLKARLFTPAGYLCCVGTSATMGAKESAEGIRQYAEKVFGEPFEADAVILEDRLTPSEFFADHEPDNYTLPAPADMEVLRLHMEDDDLPGYLAQAAKSWLGLSYGPDAVMAVEARLALGQALLRHSFTQSMLELMAGRYLQASYISPELGTHYAELSQLPDAPAALDGLFALISHARTGSADDPRPFLQVQVQLWLRELRRLVGKVSVDDVTYALSTDLNDQQVRQYLPVVTCRDCGETGWASIANERGIVAMDIDLRTFYNLYFKADDKIILLFPHEHEPKPADMSTARLCPKCMRLLEEDLNREACPSCGEKTFPILYRSRPDSVGSKDSRQLNCPFCGSHGGLSIVGLRSATALSASISQMFASRFNDDKKTLAFSDNVQDAAHRASFFNSRTWRFGFRSAMQHWAQAGGNGMNLEDFSKGFLDYWRNKQGLTTEDYIGRFIAPNMTWMRTYEKLAATGKLDPGEPGRKLLEDVEKRAFYEVMLEYGISSRTGRTLEKSGCSCLTFEGDAVHAVAERVLERSRNELGVLQKTDATAVERMVLGFLNYMRLSGAFSDGVFDAFTRSGGRAYLLSNDRLNWLPGQSRSTPRFMQEPGPMGRPLSAFDQADNPKYTRWIVRCTDERLTENAPQEISRLIRNELVKEGLLAPMAVQGADRIWGLNKGRVFVTTDVAQYTCDVCGTTISAPAGIAGWEDAPCLREKCSGHLHVDPGAALGYYGKLYNGGDIVRVVAKEHTGLLERDDREDLEKVFKRNVNEQSPWDANVLSCTPTLEMGIDIGDLSTVVLCSIPPAQAQFLQRAGRAGRRDGNALTLAVANARPHDLFFYADPMEMIAGVVDPPDVFLRASAVLERQFVAYCLDCWVKSGVPVTAVPENVQTCLSNLEKKPKDIFPFNYLSYVQKNHTSLLRQFKLLFQGHLDKATSDELELFAEGKGVHESPLHLKVLEAFAGLKKQKRALQDNIKQLKKMIRELEAKPHDSSYEKEIRELMQERIALANVVSNINKKNVFNFLSDEGLLPNYAFPEAGIVLKAILNRKVNEAEEDAEGGRRRFERKVYEYNRSAAAAISEFAPLNSFYVDGRKHTIDQVDLTTAQEEKWRLCPHCSHAQLEVQGVAVANCPRCGTPAWADAGQVRPMLRVQMVYSSDDYRSSVVYDESDDRNTTFYCKQMLVDVDESLDNIKAYSMNNDEFSFGYEFVRKATLREINFGQSDIVGETMFVAGEEEVRKGFKICRYCGRIQADNTKPSHTYTCKAKNQSQGDGDPYETCLFLYRELTTEALRILIPSTTMDTDDVRSESFTAAFMLGMKKYFGNVDHLRACVSEVPVPDAVYQKKYLVVYDSVPGGTGYLKQLLQNKNSMVEIFEKALEVMENCTCKDDPQKDGCYHCLFAYRQSNSIGQISRSTAIKLLRAILTGKNALEEISTLNSLPVNSLFESELERMFIAALERMHKDSRPVQVDKELVNGKEGYRLKAGESVWEIELQVNMDTDIGVAVNSRADFVLWPKRGTGNQLPVAVFTDGFLYHKDSAAVDTLKREAIRRSGRFRVWTLSYKDVQSLFQQLGDYATATLQHQMMPSPQYYISTVKQGHAEGLRVDTTRPMELLMQYLSLPNAEALFEVHTRAFALSLLEPNKRCKPPAFSEWLQLVQPVLEIISNREDDFALQDTIFGKWQPHAAGPLMTILAGISAEDMLVNKSAAAFCVLAVLNDKLEERTDKYEAVWNGFWHFFNVMQFLPGFAAVTVSGVEQAVYSALVPRTTESTLPAEQVHPIDDTWADIIDRLYDTQAKAMADRLLAVGAPPPSDVGYELTNDAGAVVAEAELVWLVKKIAFQLPGQEGDQEFINRGWTVLALGSAVTPEIFNGGQQQ